MIQECPIIELVGIPGCGKTTATKYAVKQLEKDGMDVLFLNDLFLSKLELIKGSIRGWKSYSRPTIGERNAWKKYANSVSGVPLNIKKKIDWIERLQFLYCYRAISELSYCYDVVIADQWIFQHAFSILHDQDMKEYLSDLKDLDSEVAALFNGRYSIIKCDLTLEQNVKRIQNREQGQSVIDGMSVDKLSIICKLQINNISNYSNGFLQIGCYNVDFNGNERDCAETIINTIKRIVR